MVDFPSAVAVPPTSAYGPPQVDFNWLANLANDYYKGQQNQFNQQQNQQTTALQQAFKGGLPTNPDGTINYQAMAQTLAQKGDINAVPQLAPYIQTQQNIKNAQQPDPLLGGGAPQPQAQPAPQSQSQQPVGDLPPASAGLARPTTATGQQPASPQGGPTVAAIVSSVVPNGPLSGTVSANVAKALKVDPSTPLNDEQQARAVSLVRSYAQRRPQPTPDNSADPGLPRLQNAVFGQESTYGLNNKTSSAGAAGPMQITQGTFDQFAAPGEKISNTTDNKDVGNRILASYWKRYNGDAARAAVAYYSGPGNVAPPDSPTPWKRDISKDKNGKPILPVSQYVDQVMNRMGTGALREATAQPPMAPGQRVAQSFGMVPGMGAPPQVAAAPQGPAPIAAGQPAAAALPPQAMPTQGPAPPQAEPAVTPLVPTTPLPVNPATGKPFATPAEAIGAIDRRIAALVSTGNPYEKGNIEALTDLRKRIEDESKPMIKSVGGNIVDLRTGKILSSSGGLFSPEDAHLAALRLYQGDNSALQGLGRGAQRAQNIKLVYDAIRDIGNERGMSETEIAKALTTARADFAGQMSYQRAGGTYGMRVAAAASEVEQALPLAVQASQELPRTKFVPWNQLVQSWEAGTSDPAYNDFVFKNFSLINAYTRAMNPTGQPRITERLEQKANNILNKATDQRSYEIQARALWQEVTRSEKAIANARTGNVDPNAAFPDIPKGESEAITGTGKGDSQGGAVKWVRRPDGSLGPAQ